MAEFTSNFQSLKAGSSFPLIMEMDSNQNHPSVNFLDNIPVLFSDSFFPNQPPPPPPRFLENWGENLPPISSQANQITPPVLEPHPANYLHETKKRNLETDDHTYNTESSSGNSSPHQLSQSKNSSGKGKRSKKGSENDDENPREVVHVRARRGQATDSHSVAERTMGMTVMLDEIINYVQILAESS